jgi:3-hydroxyisobutyrate dehydrogenase-like beta-hydroxyacid dehydrogenase
MAGSVGFVGLGNMGRPMALNLVKAGFELVVHDINSARLEPLVAAGATVEPNSGSWSQIASRYGVPVPLLRA